MVNATVKLASANKAARKTKTKSKPKKVAISKGESSTAAVQLDTMPDSTTKAHEASSSNSATTVVGSGVPKLSSTGWFTSEIQSMMHGFGDYRRPLVESAQLIEEIVHQQMNSLLIQASEIAMTRGARFIGMEDILFLLRKDKIKLRRLLRYLEVKDMKATLMKGLAGSEDGDVAEVVGTLGTKPAACTPKRRKVCYDFLSSIDQTGELLALFQDDSVDDVKLERDVRVEQLSRCMDIQQYMQFCNARRASFAMKYGTAKFRDWLLKDNLTDIKPNALALEIFHYMAYETVAQIVDLALLVKQDAKGHSGNRMECVIPPSVYSPEYPGIHLLQQNRLPVFSPPEASPQNTSAYPPHSPAVASTPRASREPAGDSNSTGKPNSNKRKMFEGKDLTEIPTSKCIQPSDIREAVQRYWRQGGPFALFSRIHCSHMRTRLLCT